MALQATPYRFKVQLNHVDRGVYEALDVRMARHPSETERHLLARLLSYCIFYEQGLAFSKGGLSSPDEPPIARVEGDGSIALWIEVGSPSAERLHKASKAAERVIVVTHHDPALLQRELDGKKIHKREAIAMYALAPHFLDEIARGVGDRGAAFDLTITEGTLYVQLGDASMTGSLTSLGE
jgi:uncharacterized protein YaeQ